MKRHCRMSILLLTSLFLVGCGNTHGQVSDSASSTTSTTSAPTTSKSITDSSPTISTAPTTPAPITTAPATTSSQPSVSTPASSSSTSIYDTTKWDRETVDLMIEHLDGQIIPYLDIGNYVSFWMDDTTKAKTYLSISGEAFDVSKINGFKRTLQSAGWTVIDDVQTYLTATHRNYRMEVHETSNDFEIKVFYDCVYDETKARTSWESDVEKDIQANLDGLTIPYLYLGCQTNYVTYNAVNKEVSIYGYTFNSQILENAKKVFLESDGWTVSDTGTTLLPALSITKTFSNDDVLTVTVATPEMTTDRYSIKVTMSENWNSAANTKWSTDIEQTFRGECEDHVPTYFYLGTKNPNVSYSSENKRFTITGGVYDDRTIPGVKTALTNAGWSVTDTRNAFGVGLEAIYTDKTEGYTFKVIINHPVTKEDRLVATLYYFPKLTIPATATEWSTDIAGMFATYLHGDDIPYIYLGDEDMVATYNERYCQLMVQTRNARTFSTPSIVINAESVLAQAGWSITSETTTFGEKMTAEKTFSGEGESNDRIVATLDSVSPTGKASLIFQIYENYDSDYEGSWADNRSYDDTDATDNTSTLYQMKQDFGGHVIPYINLGAKYPVSKWDSSSRIMTVFGGQWNNQIISDAQTSFTNDNESKAEGDSDWDMTLTGTDASAATGLTATKTFADQCVLTVQINKPTDPDYYPVHATQMTITYRDAWGAKVSVWSPDVINAMENAKFPGTNLVPYVYLGMDEPVMARGYQASNSYSSYNYITLTGATWDDRVLTEFEASMTKDGWTLFDSGKRFNSDSKGAIKYLYETTTDAGGNEVTAISGALRTCIYRNTLAANATITMAVYYDAAVTIPEAVDYTPANLEAMKSALDGTDESILPLFYMGSRISVRAATDRGGYLALSPSNGYLYNFFYLKNIADTLTQNGWTSELVPIAPDSNGYAPSYYSTSIHASKTGTNGTFDFQLSSIYASGFSATVYYQENYVVPTGSNACWSEDTKNAFSSHLGGYVLPYFYLGAKNPKVTQMNASASNNRLLILQGSTWDDQIYTEFENALKGDTVVTDWTITKDYSTVLSRGETLVATGTYNIVIPAEYDDTGTTIVTPERTEPHYITLKLYHDTEQNHKRPFLEVYYY